MIPLCVPQIEGNEWEYIKDCLDTNWVSSVGSYVNLFEDRFKEYVGAKTSVVTMNGTMAITLALQVLGIGSGDEVIVPSMTFIASVNPIKYVGADPVFVDITPDTWVMDVAKVEEMITEKTKAIIPVHVYGNMVDMEPLMRLAKKYGIYVIEDATEALGSKYMTSDGIWHMAGTIGHIGTFSFNGNKLITTGAGGMLVTDIEEWGNKAKYYANQTKTVLPNGAFYHEEVGYNYRMPNLLAAMGVAQLEKIEKYLAIKINNADIYNRLLEDVNGVQCVVVKRNVKHCQWLYSVLLNDEFRLSRDELIRYLEDNGVISRPFFHPIHDMKPYINSKHNSLVVTNIITSQGINLPSSVNLTEKEIVMICNLIRGC